MCQDNGTAIDNISACQTENNAKFAALDSAAGKIKQDLAFIQVRNERFMSNQADNCNKMAAMDSKMMEMLSSAAEVSVSVQKDVRSFEKRLIEAVATKPAEPNHTNSVPDQKSTKPVCSTRVIKST